MKTSPADKRKPLPKMHRGDMEDTDQDISFKCTSEIPPAIPDGEYEVIFIKAEKKWMWSRVKVYLWFQIITEGEWFGGRFYGVCNIPPDGKFTPSHKFWQWWVLAADRRPDRFDRLSTSVFRNQVFLVRMRTVLKTAKQKNRTHKQMYSVIDELLQIQIKP